MGPLTTGHPSERSVHDMYCPPICMAHSTRDISAKDAGGQSPARSQDKELCSRFQPVGDVRIQL